MKKKCTSACISQHHPAHDGLDPPEWRSLGICIALLGSKTLPPRKVEQTPSEQPIRYQLYLQFTGDSGRKIRGLRRTKYQETGQTIPDGLRLTQES